MKSLVKKFGGSLLLLTLIVSLSGCISNPNRKWFGSNTVGHNLNIVEDSTTGAANTDVQGENYKALKAGMKSIDGHAKGSSKSADRLDDIIDDKAPEISPETTPHTDSIRKDQAAIRAKAKELNVVLSKSEKLNSQTRELLRKINKEAQGKKYMSRTTILMMWILGISVILLIFGFAVKNLPFFQPIERLLSGSANAVMDVASGAYQARKRAQIQHLNKTSTIANGDMSHLVQAQIQEELAQQKLEEAHVMLKEARIIKKKKGKK